MERYILLSGLTTLFGFYEYLSRPNSHPPALSCVVVMFYFILCVHLTRSKSLHITRYAMLRSDKFVCHVIYPKRIPIWGNYSLPSVDLQEGRIGGICSRVCHRFQPWLTVSDIPDNPGGGCVEPRKSDLRMCLIHLKRVASQLEHHSGTGGMGIYFWDSQCPDFTAFGNLQGFGIAKASTRSAKRDDAKSDISSSGWTTAVCGS